MDRCVSNKSSTATAIAIASRALRPCDVCGRERAKWYCKADEAYLCEHCDASVHGANTVSLRHERLRLGPNGQPTKNLKRLPPDEPTTNVEPVAAPALMQGSRKRPRSSRGPKVKVEPPDESPKAAATAAAATAAAADEFLKSFIVASSEDEQFFDTDVLVDSSHEVPIFVPEVYSDDVPSDGFSVPSSAVDDDSPRTDHSVELCFDPFADSEGDLCDMDGIISGTMDMEAISDLGEVLGLCDDSKELCDEAYGLDFPTNASDSAENAATPSDGNDFCTTKVKLEEADDLDKIKLEVDEMLGFAFSTNSCVKEEVLEQKPIKLRLNYEDVLNAWSDRGPFWTEGPRPQTVPDDSSFDPTSTWDTGLVPESSMESLHIGEGIAQVPVVNFGDGVSNSGGREARVLRYREKRRTRLFSKKIRYEVRKLNAERRPRLKGRFVKRINM